MRALIWREIRALRNPALIGVGIALALGLLVTRGLWGAPSEAAIGQTLRVLFVGWAVLIPLAGLMLGCNMIAQERARREEPFSHSWPVSASAAWAAKLIVGLGALVVFAVLLAAADVLVAELVAEGMHGYTVQEHGDWERALQWAPLPAAIALALFGIGLLMSTIRPSPFEALASAIIAIILLIVALGYLFLDFIPQRWGPEIGLWPTIPPAGMGTYVAAGLMLFVACAVGSYLGFTRTRPLQFGRRMWSALGWGSGLTVLMVVLLPIGVRFFGEPRPDDITMIAEAQTSPDGRWTSITDAWGVQNATPARLWIMSADGTDLRCISRWPVRADAEWQHPRWLPFIWGPSWAEESIVTRGQWIWAWDMEQMAARKLPHPPHDLSSYLPMSISPDGRYFMGNWIIRLDDLSAEPIPLPRNANFAGWGPEPDRVYLTLPGREGAHESVWSMRLPDGGDLRRFAEAPDDRDWGARVSPDGRWVRWSHYAGQDHTMVLEEVASGGEWTFGHAQSIYHGWSPDGRFLWFRDPGGHCTVPLTEEPTRRRVDLPEPWWPWRNVVHWSVDGDRCAFAASRSRGRAPYRQLAVFVANADGTGARMVCRGEPEGDPMHPAIAGWREDGRVVVVEDYRTLVAIDPETGERAVVFEVR